MPIDTRWTSKTDGLASGETGAAVRPPVLDPPAFWEDLYTELAGDLELSEKTLEEAVQEARAFIDAFDASPAQ
jgi:hypothetical protein